MRIDLQGVSKRFGGFTALEDVTLEVAEGSLTALLGPSGSGKSTLLRIIAGLEAPDAGAVLIDGVEVTAARPQDRGIGFVFQHYAAFTHMSVRENVAFGLRIRKRPREEVKERVDELLIAYVAMDEAIARLSLELREVREISRVGELVEHGDLDLGSRAT